MLYTLLVLACTKDPETVEYTPAPKPQGGEVVTVTTRDSVDIVADYYASSSADSAAGGLCAHGSNRLQQP